MEPISNPRGSVSLEFNTRVTSISEKSADRMSLGDPSDSLALLWKPPLTLSKLIGNQSTRFRPLPTTLLFSFTKMLGKNRNRTEIRTNKSVLCSHSLVKFRDGRV